MKIDNSLEFPLWVENLNCAWRSILRTGYLRKFSKGTLVSSDNGSETGFYFLEQGMVRLLFYPSHFQQPNAIIIIREGTLFGEVPELSQCLNAVFECLEPCTTYFFPFAKVFTEEFASKYPLIMMELARSLGIKLNRIALVLSQRECYSASVNVARYLYTINKYSELGQVKNCICSHSELASLLGIHRSTLSAILKSFKEQGLLEVFTKYKIVLGDKDKLIDFIMSNLEKSELTQCNINK